MPSPLCFEPPKYFLFSNSLVGSLWNIEKHEDYNKKKRRREKVQGLLS